MSARCFLSSIALLCLTAVAHAETVTPSSQPSASDPLFSVSLHHAHATEAAQAISDITGKAFSVPSVMTDLAVDMGCERKLTREQTYNVFLLSLAAKGIRLSRAKTHIFMKETPGLNPSRLPDAEEIDAKIVASQVDYVTTGFLIYSIRPDSVFDRAGLHDGDIVREVNGQPLDWAAGPCALYEAVTSVKAANILVERKQRLSLSLPPH